MTLSTPDESRSALDQAIAERLARLGDLPVNTSRLEEAVRSEIRRENQRGGGFFRSWPRRFAAVAASIVVLAGLAAVLILTMNGPVLASPAQMAQVHQDLVSGKTPVMQVSSIEAANKMLAGQWPESPEIPDVPGDHVMACCMKSVRNKKMACVLLKKEGVPITMTVAKASEMRLPSSPTVDRNGVTYHVQSVSNLNMVMAEKEGRWVCLIAELPVDRIIDVAEQMRF